VWGRVVRMYQNIPGSHGVKSSVVIVTGLLLLVGFYQFAFSSRELFSTPGGVSERDVALGLPNTSSVLEDNTKDSERIFVFHIPVRISDLYVDGVATFKGGFDMDGQDIKLGAGKITASNIINSIKGVGGIQVTGENDLTISYNGGLANTGTPAANNINSIKGLGGIQVTGDSDLTISYSGGVSALVGTTDQVTISATTGNVTLSLPQNIGVTSSPTFAGITLSSVADGLVKSVNGVLSGGNTVSLSEEVSGVLPVSKGGTGLEGFDSNYVYKGNGTGPLVKSSIYESGRNIGIGTTTPEYELDVSGTGKFTGDLLLSGSLVDGLSSAGSSGYILTSTGSSTAWSSTASAGIVTGSGTDNYISRFNAAGTGIENGSIVDAGSGTSINIDSSGNVGLGGATAGVDPFLYVTSTGVGVGTTTPERPLEVAGAMRLDASSTPVSAVLGDMYTNADGNIYFYNGTSWDDLTALGTGYWTQTGTDLSYGIGNIGIGTTASTYKLDVNGTARISGATIISPLQSDEVALTLRAAISSTGDIFNVTNTTGTEAYLTVNSTDVSAGTAIKLTNASSTLVGTSVLAGWSLTGNDFNYRRPITVTNNSGSTIPSNYQISITLSSTDAAQVFANTQAGSPYYDLRTSWDNGGSPVEIARNMYSHTSSNVTFTFQLSSSIAPAASDTYYLYYSNSALNSIGAQYASYVGDIQIDSMDSLGVWTSSDTTQYPLSLEGTIKQEGTGSIKALATADNIGVFSTTSQGQLATARTNFGFTTASFAGNTYAYAVGGSSDGTAANSLSSIEFAAVNATTGNVGSFSTSANSLPSSLMDTSVVSATPPVDSGTGADGSLDLSLTNRVGGCTGAGLTWDFVSKCTINKVGSSNTDSFIYGAAIDKLPGYAAHSFIIPSGPQAGKTLMIVANSSSSTQIYDPATNTYTAGPSLGANAYTGSHSFAITSGPNTGKILVVVGESALTRIYNPATHTFSAGPDLETKASTGSHSFAITTGPQAGKVLTITANASSITKLYDPATNAYSAGPSLGVNTGDGAHSMAITTGPQAGKILTITGNGSSVTKLYDPATNTYSAGPSLGVNTGSGSHSFVIPSGSESGKILTVTGSTSVTKIYDPATNTYGAGPDLGTTPGLGSHSFVIPSGSEAGKILTVSANLNQTTVIYNPATNTYGAGPNVGISAWMGSHSFLVSSGPIAGKIITVPGAGNNTAIKVYDPATNTYGAGPSISSLPIVYTAAHSVLIPSGPQMGNYLVILGGVASSTKIYDTMTDSFSEGPSLGASAGSGSHSFVIPSGSESGKILTFIGEGTSVTKLYDPATNTYSAGPSVGANVRYGAHSVAISTGPSAGKILTLLGNNSSVSNIYDPATNTFSAGPSIGATVAEYSHSFVIPSGSEAGKIMTIAVFGTTSVRLYNPATNTYGAGPSLGANADSGSHSFVIPSGSEAGKILTVTGSTSVTKIYDPATNTYGAGPDLGTTPRASAHSFLVETGPYAGFVLTITANSNVTKKYNPSTNTFSTGSTAASPVGQGGHTIAITSGLQKGKFLVLLGGQSQTTVLYDPGKNSYNFTTMNIPSGKTLDATTAIASTSNFMTMKATGNVTIAGTILLDGAGYAGPTTTYTNGSGDGYGSLGVASTYGGGGGSYGGAGGTGGNGLGGGVYTGDDSGSSGGSGSGASSSYSAGGGGLRINSGGDVLITGSISANGAVGYAGTTASGGGSGGGIHIQSTDITVSGILSVNGGGGGNGTYGGGGGGGGRVTLEHMGLLNTSGSTITVAGGVKGSGGVVAQDGSLGVYSNSALSSVLYVLGGKNTSGSAVNQIYQSVIDPTDGTLSAFSTSAVPLVSSLFAHTTNALTIGTSNYLYVLGGNTGSADATTVYKGTFSGSNIAAFTTTSQVQLPLGISYHTATMGTISSTNYIWVIGGLNGSTAQTTVYKGTINSSGNIVSLTTSGQSSLPQGLYGHTTYFDTVGFVNYLYVTGGTTTGGTKQSTVYRAVVDASGNVGAFSTVGQTQLTTPISNHQTFRFTDTSSNRYTYTIGGNTGTVQNGVLKTLYSPIDQTTYALSKTISSVDLTNKNSITFEIYSSRTGSYMAYEFYNGSGWQSCGDNSDFSSGVFSVSSANVWERKTCDISAVSPRSSITQIRYRVTSSSTTEWTAYIDDINGMINAATISNTSFGGTASLSTANLDINAQGDGAIRLNYDATNSLAGTGGLKVYNGGSTLLFSLNSAGNGYVSGNLGIGTTNPTSKLTVNAASPSANALLFNVQNTGSNVFSVDAEGDYFYDGTGSSPSADVAEVYPTDETGIVPGTVVSLSTKSESLNSKVGKSEIVYDPDLLGVVTTKPALLLGSNVENGVAVALVGRVPVIVNDQNGEIKKGDYITSSSISGEGMKATVAGMVVGRALSNAECVTSNQELVTSNLEFSPSAGEAGDSNLEIKGSETTACTVSVFTNLSWYDPNHSTLALSNTPVDTSSLNDLRLQTLSVLGASTFTNATVTGRLNVGALSLENSSLNVPGGVLKLQNGYRSGNVDVFNGKIVMKTDGSIEVTGKVTAQQIEANTVTVHNGITVYDEATGNPTCVTVREGLVTVTAGVCGE